MNGEALINVCQAAIHGSDRFVRNIRDNRTGRVISCSSAGLEVLVGTEREVWAFNDCEDMGEKVLRSA